MASLRRWIRALCAALALASAPLGCEPRNEPQQSVAPPASSSAARGVTSTSFTPKLELPSLGPEPTLHGVGERALARDYAMTVLSVESCVVEPHFRPAKGHIKLGVQVELEGRSERQVPANPFVATLLDSEQQGYQVDIAGCTPTLRARQLSRGQKAKGYISFEVPDAARGLVMSYAPFVVGAGPEELKFSLQR